MVSKKEITMRIQQRFKANLFFTIPLAVHDPKQSMIFDSKTVLKAPACLFLKISTCSRLDVRLERQASSQECIW